MRSHVFVAAAFSPPSPMTPPPIPASSDISINSSGKSTGDGDHETHQQGRGSVPPLDVIFAPGAAAA